MAKYALIRLRGFSPITAKPEDIQSVGKSDDDFLDLWKKLDAYTAQNIPVVIVDIWGEIRAGNTLGYERTIAMGQLMLPRLDFTNS